MAFARVVVHHEFADGLGHAVGGLWGDLGTVGVRVLHGLAAKARDAAGEDHARTSRSRARGFKDIATTIEIHAQGIVKALLALTAHHRRQMEDRGRRLGTDGGEYGCRAG